MNQLDNKPWYDGITRYQWLVLIVACLGWIFDVFEGQVFVASMQDAMPDLLGTTADDPKVSGWNNWAFGSFMLGGAVGGIFFGMMSDRVGRTKTMMITILFYSAFTCVTAFAQQPWQMVILRFFVAMGVGGEWAVASAMVAEVMPKRARAITSSIFHASSVFGTLLAVAAISLLIGNEELNASLAEKGIDAWRVGFAIGALPALLILWIRWKLKEPDSWKAARERAKNDPSQKQGRLGELFAKPQLRATLVGVTLATVGLVTFWGIHIYGKNALMRNTQAEVLRIEKIAPDADKSIIAEAYQKHKSQIKKSEMLSMTFNTVGGGLGLILFGTIANRLGRKGAFIMYHALAFVMTLILFLYLIPDPNTTNLTYMLFLPIFGFFTLGMHAGYAVYFPELYPTRLRGTGAGFCFNMGRLGTASAFFFFGSLATPLLPEQQALWLSPLYIVGLIVVLFGKETRGAELPD
ncbi:MAG: MFS transporter [Verrucomicrobiales bacterium]|nr:MFS transporter [Verrucomicrobiales bacterium]